METTKTNKIDIVIAWVDGSDPKWQEERANTFQDIEFSNRQFRDWGLLKYWFRGIEENAALLVFKNHVKLVDENVRPFAFLPVKGNTVQNGIGDNEKSRRL